MQNEMVQYLHWQGLEQISFEARESEYIDNKSGVSAEHHCFENLLSTKNEEH
jgi:hypothetical protein